MKNATSISFPKPANFLRRMLDENEGSAKDQFLGDPDWLSEMQYNTISPLFANFQNQSFPEPSFSSSTRHKKLEGSGYEIHATQFYSKLQQEEKND